MAQVQIRMMRITPKQTKVQIVLISVFLVILYWTLEVFFDSFILKRGNFLTLLLEPGPRELWIRFAVSSIVLSSGAVILKICRESQKAVKEIESGYKEAINLLPQTIFEIDRDGKFTFVNDDACEVFGYSKEEFANMLSAPLIISPEDRERVAENIGRILSGEVFDCPGYTFVRKDGTSFPAKVYAKVVMKDDLACGIRGMIVDITDLKEKELELGKMSMAVHQSPVSIVITDKRGTIEYVNPVFSDITGYSLEEARGKNPRILKSGQTPIETYDTMWQDITGGNPWRGTLLNRKKNGEFYWEDVRIAPIKDVKGEITHYVGVKEDITAQREAADAIRKLQDRLLLALSATEAMSWEADLKTGSFTSWPEEFYFKMGFDVCDIPQTIDGHMGMVYQDDKDTVLNAFQRHLTGEAELYRTNVRLLCKSGEWRWFSSIGEIIERNDSGEAVKVMGFTYNIDELVRRREEIAEFAEKLQSTDMLKGLFIDIINHDILNPLNIILNSAQMLDDMETDDIKKDLARLVLDSASDINHIIRDASLYSRLESIDNIDKIKEDVHLIFSDVISKFSDSFSEKKMTVCHQVSGICEIFVNSLFKEVIANLVSNAIKYGKPGTPVECGVEDRGDIFVLYVKNQGEAIPDEDKERIFKRFERLKKGSIKGKGLGLSIAKKIVDLHGGRIWVEDVTEGGSIFKIELAKD